MPTVSRLGDISIGICDHGQKCCPHVVTGWKVTCEPTVLAEGAAVVRASDIGYHTCPHCGININEGFTPTVMYGSACGHGLNHKVNEICGDGRTITSCTTVMDES